jgi:hypothetical protein
VQFVATSWQINIRQFEAMIITEYICYDFALRFRE